jgi:hypothetical protein
VNTSFEGNRAFFGSLRFHICTHYGKTVLKHALRLAVTAAVIKGGYAMCALAVPHLQVICSGFVNQKSRLSAMIPAWAFLLFTPKHICSPDALKGT